MRKAYIFAGLSILCWSSVSTAFKLSLNYLTPLGLLFFSSFAAFVFLLLLNLIFPLPRTETKHISIPKNILLSLLHGILNPFLYYLLLFEAYNRLRAQEAQVLNYTWAIVLSVMSAILYRNKMRGKDIVALLISFLGVVIIANRGNIFCFQFDDLLGTTLALASSLIWASYWLMNMRDKRSIQSRLLYNFMVGAGVTGLYVLISYCYNGSGLLFRDDSSSMVKGILGAVYVGIFEMGLTFLLWNKALSSTKNTASIANLIFLTPFLSLVFIAILLREAIHPATLIGLILIIGSNLIQKHGDMQRQRLTKILNKE